MPGITVVVGVPRLYAALIAGIEARAKRLGWIVATVFDAAVASAAWVRRCFGINAGRWIFHRPRARFGGDLRLLVSGGAHLAPEVFWPLFGLGFEVRSGYGLAETASIFTGNLPGRERLGTDGRPFQGGELRLAEPNEQGVGEIQLRGPNVFTGYRKNPQANREAFTEEGWFRTWDLGSLDSGGYLTVIGRTKEMLVLGGGKKVHPEELEKVYGHSSYIREIAVLERAGVLVALVAPDLEAIRATGEQRVEDVIRVGLAVQSQALPPYQRLSGFVLVREPLPRTRFGKYRRFLLPEIYYRAHRGIVRPPSAEPQPEDRELLAQPVPKQIWTLLQERYPQNGMALDAHLQLDLGIDSLEWLGLLLAIEQRMGLQLSEQETAQVETVRDLLRAANVAVAGTLRGERAKAGVDLKWIAPPGQFLTAVGVFLYWVNRHVMRMLFRLTVSGRERLPATGPYVIVANHASDLDPLAFAAVLDLAQMRRTYWGGAASRLFTRRWGDPFWRALHVMPIDERLPASSLGLASMVLARGDHLIWFPEAWRSPDGTVQRFLPGVGKLIGETGALVVPAFISGSFEALPRGRRLPRLHPIHIWFDAPLSAAQLIETGRGETPHARITDSLYRIVRALEERAARER